MKVARHSTNAALRELMASRGLARRDVVALLSVDGAPMSAATVASWVRKDEHQRRMPPQMLELLRIKLEARG